MAAPYVASRAIQLRQVFSQLRVHPAVVAGQLQQVRFKKRQGQVKGPAESKVKEKWVARTEKVKKKELPKNWEEKVMSRVPMDDVWYRKYYPRPQYTVEQAITMHCELAQPAMTDNMDGLVHLDCQLNFRTNKKTKFLSNVKKTVILPHPFDDGTENRVLAFCKTQEEKEAALAAGAAFAGGIELVKSLEKGEIRGDDWDHAVCTVEMVADVAKVRKPLKDHFPHKSKGNLGTDIVELVTHFSNGKTYESTKLEDAVGELRVTIGKLNMPMEQLVENFHAYVADICSLQKTNSPGPFIMSAMLVCPPSTELFAMQPAQLRPEAPKKSKKQQKAEEADEDDEPSHQDDDSDDEDQQVAARK